MMKTLHFYVDLYAIAFQYYKKIATKIYIEDTLIFMCVQMLIILLCLDFSKVSIFIYSRSIYFRQSTRKLTQFRLCSLED